MSWFDLYVEFCSPVQDVADSCKTGAATNVIFGLALGYKSVIIPIFAIAIAIYVSFSLAAMYGIAVAALGMLSTIATGLAIDAYGPISDNAGGIAEMAGMSHKIRERTDALDAAGNTTAAIGKVGPLINPLMISSQTNINSDKMPVTGFCHWISCSRFPCFVRCLCQQGWDQNCRRLDP